MNIFENAWEWLSDKAKKAYEWVKDKIDEASQWLEEVFGNEKYNEDNVEDQVNADAALAEFREQIEKSVNDLEKGCMESLYSLFQDLKDKIKDRFPDLIEIIDNEQSRAKEDLEGTVMQSIKEKLSKNNIDFTTTMGMNPGILKKVAIKGQIDKAFKETENEFYDRLEKYANHVLEEFQERLECRINDQVAQMNKKIKELEELKKQAENGQIDIDSLREKSVPLMEAAQCIIQILNREAFS